MSASNKHILILSSWYPYPDQPFLGNFVERHAKLLSQEFEVTVLNTYPSIQAETQVDTTKGFNEIKIAYSNQGGKIQRRAAQEKAFKKGLQQLGKIDLIIAHIGLPRGLQFIEAKKRLHCPLIYVEHGSYFRDEKRAKWSLIEKIIVRKLAKKADAIVAVSGFLKKDMKKFLSASEIKVIGNSVDENLFSLKEKKTSSTTHFLHVSTLDAETKNPQGIIEACGELAKRKIDFQLTIISDESYATLEEDVRGTELEGKITFAGPLEWSELVPYYHKSDCFLLNSNYETFSIVLAEALLTGTAFISTPVGIASELDEGSHIRIKANDPMSLANAMEDFILGNVSFETNKLRERGMNYSNTSILEKWKTLINELV